MIPCNFSLKHYQSCLETAQKSGYKFLTMKEAVELKAPQKKVIVLRHDIDHQLRLALKFAKIEKSLGIKATYFIRLHARYHPFSHKGYRVLKQLKEMNHELGLHYDCDFATLFDEDPRHFLRRDKELFETLIQDKVHGVSPHEPMRSSIKLTDKEANMHGFLYQAYTNLFTKDMKYISDSSCRWREGCMCEFIKKEEPRLCILTHPIWWFKASPLENY